MAFSNRILSNKTYFLFPVSLSYTLHFVSCFLKQIKFVITVFVRMTSKTKYDTLRETDKALNSSNFNDDIIKLKFKPGRRTFLERKGYNICLDYMSTNTQANLKRFTEIVKQSLAKYLMMYTKKEISKWNLLLFYTDFNIFCDYPRWLQC